MTVLEVALNRQRTYSERITLRLLPYERGELVRRAATAQGLDVKKEEEARKVNVSAFIRQCCGLVNIFETAAREQPHLTLCQKARVDLLLTNEKR